MYIVRDLIIGFLAIEAVEFFTHMMFGRPASLLGARAGLWARQRINEWASESIGGNRDDDH